MKKNTKKKKKPLKKKAAKKRTSPKKKAATAGTKRQSKTENFLENIRKNNSMIEYITALRIMNPAARLSPDPTEPRREGGFVRLAHAREEFPAPVLNKGKAFEARKREEQSQAGSGKIMDENKRIDDTGDESQNDE